MYSYLFLSLRYISCLRYFFPFTGKITHPQLCDSRETTWINLLWILHISCYVNVIWATHCNNTEKLRLLCNAIRCYSCHRIWLMCVILLFVMVGVSVLRLCCSMCRKCISFVCMRVVIICQVCIQQRTVSALCVFSTTKNGNCTSDTKIHYTLCNAHTIYALNLWTSK